jgi:hypothetical protein
MKNCVTNGEACSIIHALSYINPPTHCFHLKYFRKKNVFDESVHGKMIYIQLDIIQKTIPSALEHRGENTAIWRLSTPKNLDLNNSIIHQVNKLSKVNCHIKNNIIIDLNKNIQFINEDECVKYVNIFIMCR